MKTARMFLIAAALGGLAQTSSASAADSAARCFEPLKDFTSRNPKDFEKFSTRDLPEPAEGVIKLQPPDDGFLSANIDFYHVTFTAPKTISQKDFFKKIRLRYPSFARGQLKQYAFAPYGGRYTIFDYDGEDAWYKYDNKPESRLREQNAKLWAGETASTKGALMTFNLGTIFGATGRVAGKSDWVWEKAGDVQVVCASETDFIFSTARTDAGGWHPVSGYRGFGLMTDPANANQWIFYSMAVDRRSRALKNAATWVPFIDSLFCKGHIFWIGFFSEIRTYIYQQKLQVVTWSLKNHGPVPYPLGTESQPPLDCGTMTEPPKD